MDNNAIKFPIENYRIVKNSSGIYYIDNVNFVFLKVNDLGNHILNMLDGKNTNEDIIRKISDKYQLPKDIIKEDISVFIDNIDLHMSNTVISDERELLTRVYIDLFENQDGIITELEFGKIKLYFDKIGKFLAKDAKIIVSSCATYHSNFDKIIEYFSGLSSDIKILLNINLDESNKLMNSKCISNISCILIDVSDFKDSDLLLSNENSKEKLILEFINNYKGKLPIYLTVQPDIKNIKFLRNIQKFAYELGMDGLHIKSIFNINADNNYELVELFNKEVRKLANEHTFLNSWKNNVLKKASNAFTLSTSENLCLNSIGNVKKKYHCGKGINEIRIKSNGKVNLCHINNTMVESLENMDNYIDTRKELIDNLNISDECKECDIWIYCLGGCKVKNFMISGNEFFCKQNCKDQKKIYSDILSSRMVK